MVPKLSLIGIYGTICEAGLDTSLLWSLYIRSVLSLDYIPRISHLGSVDSKHFIGCHVI